MILIRAFLIFLLLAASPVQIVHAGPAQDMDQMMIGDAGDVAAAPMDCCADGSHQAGLCFSLLAVPADISIPFMGRMPRAAWDLPPPFAAQGMTPAQRPKPPRSA